MKLIILLLLTNIHFSESIQLQVHLNNKTFEAYSTVHPKHQSTISALVQGQVQKRHIEIGDKVVKNQLLYSLDLYPHNHYLEDYQIELKKLENQLNYLHLKLSRRIKNPEAYTEEVVEEVQLQVDNTKFAISAVKSKIGLSQETLSKKFIRAPYDGIILDYFINLGESVNLASPMLSMMSVQDHFVRAMVNKDIAKTLKLGQKVEIDSNNHSLYGSILRIHPSEDQNHMQSIDISLKDSQTFVKNQVLRVRFQIAQKVIEIPKDFVKDRHQIHMIKVITKDGIELKEIQGDFVINQFITRDISLNSLKLERF